MSTSEGQGPMEGISELLRCYICMERLSNATICPHCSKLGCFSCIKRWVTDNRSNCPHCRNALTLRDLITIPLFDDLGQVLDTLQDSTKEVSISPSSSSSSLEKKKCALHNEKMSVYCENCKECICHECALWSEKHSNHRQSLKPLNMFYKKHMDILQGELTKLKDRMKVILSQVQQVEKKIEGVKINKSKTKREVNYAKDKMCHQLDELAKQRIAVLNEFRHHLRSQAVEITKQSHDLEKTISAGNISSLIDGNGEVKPGVTRTIQTLLSSPAPELDSLADVADFVNEVVPEYDSAIFKITSFRELQQKGEEVYSEPLELQGLVWRLKVYPNGHKEEVGNYLAVFAELSEGYQRTTNYQYCIEMLYGCTNKFPHRNHKREYASDFADGESWGYRKYYEISRLREEGFIKDNTLVLKFSIRTPTYYQKYQDQTLYLEKVVKERDALKTQVQAAKQQISTLKTECKALRDAQSSNANRIASSQHEGHTPLSLHPSQQRMSVHSSSQHHSQSTSSDHHRQRERNGRSNADGTHLVPRQSHQSSPSHNAIHSHHKKYPHGGGEGQTHRTDTLMVSAGGEAFISSSHMHLERHRESNELRKITQQRRKSADPAVVYKGSHDPRLVPHSHLNSQSRYEPHRSVTQPNLIHHLKNTSSREDLLAGGGASSSQNWDDLVLNPTDITITLDDEGDKNKSLSSSSTLIDSSGGTSSPPMNEVILQDQNKPSQETFDEDHTEMLSLSGVATGPGRTPFEYDSCSYFGEHQDMYHLPHSLITKPEPNQTPHYNQGGLSQPNLSPPKSRHGRSMTDLTGSNTNLSSSQQFSSQSMLDSQHFQQQHEIQRSPRNFNESRHHHDQWYRGQPPDQEVPPPPPQADPHRKSIPGLTRSLISALSEAREEVEQRKQTKGKKAYLPIPHVGSRHQSQPSRPAMHKSSQLPRKHLKATMVRTSESIAATGQKSPAENKRKQESSKKIKGSPEKDKVNPCENNQPDQVMVAAIGEDVQVNNGAKQDTSPQNKPKRLSTKYKAKSNSTSSLNNLSQIL